MVKLIECPRDAMQGIQAFIPTRQKAAYINQLLQVGFDTIDFGSFVSAKAIPQLKDTKEVLSLLDLENTKTKLLAIVANFRGAKTAVLQDEIDYIGYPFSISETFQLRNTNSTIRQSLHILKKIQGLCIANNKRLVVYISMGFGNPYGDEWNVEIVEKWIDELSNLEITTFALSDTIGVSTPDNISYLFEQLIPVFRKLEIGAHFHTAPYNWKEKMESALSAGCRRFDGAIKGYGGCPMAKDELIGNMPTENIIEHLDEQNINTDIDRKELDRAIKMALELFPA